MLKHRPSPAKAARSPPEERSSAAPDWPHTDAKFLIVGIGASAGGLDACRKLLDALPPNAGMAFILVQHLDPTHQSLMVDLLASHTSMTVREAADGMKLAPDHLYVIPPGAYLSVGDGALHLSQPQARHGARLPFDFLLHSLAEAYGARAVSVILSGTGGDGALGLKAVKKRGGLLIAQSPEEAGYDGMPRSAIMTGEVDLVLAAAEIPQALDRHARKMIASAPARDVRAPSGMVQEWLPEMVELLRNKTAHDFRLYKPGTLQRRIERRAGMAAIGTDDMARYLDLVRDDADELERLAKDLLINVTSFFRDPKVFELLAEQIVPDLIRNHTTDQPIRIWIAGCSTGEETYSLAMLFHEQIAAMKHSIKLQIFASDVDPDAVADAREGLYPETIEADVSPARLARFFTKEDHSYRIAPELRACVIFTVQDLLADPPFSRLDLVSCRNLLIYLSAEAQAKIISLFHFALRPGGFLLLGSSETPGSTDDRFEIVSKSARVYRQVGRSRRGDFGLVVGAGGAVRIPARPGQAPAPSRQVALAELCRRLVMETYAPAAILINTKHECLYFLGPTDRYLRVAPGQPTHDLLAMARRGLRTKLRSAIQQARRDKARVVLAGGRAEDEGWTRSFGIDVQPVQHEGEELFLVGFVDEPKHERRDDLPVRSGDAARVAELERELAATRSELQGAILELEQSSEEQKAINEEALSVNEEYQSTNEELLTSKEELQSLNEELTALNGQLQETLERQRLIANDLQNVLYSTDVATLFLDSDLNIRFFTPATRSLFNIIPGDVGRPLADLNALTFDAALQAEARAVLRSLEPLEREIEANNGAWYIRRVLPYRTQDGVVEGLVITFTDISERKQIAKAMEAAKQQAELANVAKSRFLAAASHDLRQPLQTLSLLQGSLALAVTGEKAQRLVALLDTTLSAMSGMLNSLLDINQIDAGNVRVEVKRFPVNDLFDRMRDELSYHARAKGLALRVVPCSLSVDSDPRLLEQMIRNLLANALKYTRKGKVLLGCRRHGDMLGIEIWDTGIGIPEGERQTIFEEYHQVDNNAGERNRGLGLGLSIVRRLGNLLGHRVSVRSQLGQGSVFTVEIAHQPGTLPPPGRRSSLVENNAIDAVRRTGSVLIVEDDQDVRHLLELVLTDEGHAVAAASDGPAALDLVARGQASPDLILADYNLPSDMDGIEVVSRLRERLHHPVAAIILTGDISTGALRKIARHVCLQLNKPVKLAELIQAIRDLLPTSPQAESSRALPVIAAASEPVIFVVDDDRLVREGIRRMLEEEGLTVEDYPACEDFLEAYHPGHEACLLVDGYLPGMGGLELLRRLRAAGHSLPTVVITGNSDVPMAVEAMKAGALDFLEKPIGRSDLLGSVERALEQSRDSSKLSAWRETACQQIASLTPRQRQVMNLVLAGRPSKNIATELGISQRTVEHHRASVMQKTGSKSLPALARMALAAGWNAADKPPVQPEDPPKARAPDNR